MLTAAKVTNLVTRSDEGAEAAVTAGLRVPTWAAVPPGAAEEDLAPGTINIIVSVPVPLTDVALVNAVITATEAKTQAVLDAGFPGDGDRDRRGVRGRSGLARGGRRGFRRAAVGLGRADRPRGTRRRADRRDRVSPPAVTGDLAPA